MTLNQGGTGPTSYQAGDLIVGNSSNGLSKLNTGTYGQYLKNRSYFFGWYIMGYPSSGGGSSASITNNASLTKPKKVNRYFLVI